MKQPIPQLASLSFFPRYFRFITERTFTDGQTRGIKIALVSSFSVFLLALILWQGLILSYHLRAQKAFFQQRAQLQEEVQYWEGIADKYKGYRDVYYRIASLQYKLGNIAVSQEYIEKALELDPNFPEGQVLGAKIGL